MLTDVDTVRSLLTRLGTGFERSTKAGEYSSAVAHDPGFQDMPIALQRIEHFMGEYRILECHRGVGANRDHLDIGLYDLAGPVLECMTMEHYQTGIGNQ